MADRLRRDGSANTKRDNTTLGVGVFVAFRRATHPERGHATGTSTTRDVSATGMAGSATGRNATDLTPRVASATVSRRHPRRASRAMSRVALRASDGATHSHGPLRDVRTLAHPSDGTAPWRIQAQGGLKLPRVEQPTTLTQLSAYVLGCDDLRETKCPPSPRPGWPCFWTSSSRPTHPCTRSAGPPMP
jgi:hypothetical protein